ncbi:Glycosidase [Zhouia amylolytica]|uniref:Glycosidase n=1 Tax=Zhouia amylolytica TaxID=376730 RepID=A0A1I6P3Z4_9FLAO|nr:glycoside hydrolase family 13 protein [Zhouia amylolytica]MCQ0111740.1 glycoside hydrolase family 13 protein [Zhouia amylolytica]SFS34861.1 Glycosidase [Zhouia amylolytica]
MKHAIKLIMLLLPLAISAQIDKIEPPFWWSDMAHSKLQIMVYGEEIAQYTPEVENVVVTSITKTENPNYVFITMDTKGLDPGIYNIDFKKGKRTVFSHAYELKKRAPNSKLRKGFDASDVIYLLMPDRFANGNPNNDSHSELTEKVNRDFEGGRHGGDIQGIIDHLDYVEALGATTIWSTPLCEDNDNQYSYHTYAQSDVYRIDPRYGTNEEYQMLSKELHKRDMKLIMDYVTNHWGLEHWMIKDLPTYDWIHQFPGYAQTNYRMTTQMDPNASQRDYKYCMDGWFVKTMPDLNQQNPLVLKYLIQNAIWWIEFANLDGFRVDTYSYNDKDAIALWTKAIMDEYPNFNIVGEVWMHDQAQMAYWQKDSKIGAIQNYNSYLPSVMDFTLHDAIGQVFKEEYPSWNKGMIQVYENYVNDFLYPEVNNLLIFAENHDTERINHIYPNIEDYKLIMSLIATSRGIPQIYYGSEIGMQGDKGKGDGDIRRDFPGGWPGDQNNAFKAKERTDKQNAYFDFTAKLLNWRKKAKVIHSGKTTQYLPDDEVYVYFRHNDQASVMVVINNNQSDKVLKLDRFKENLYHFSKGMEVMTEMEIDLSTNLKMPAKTSYIIELKK